MGFLDRFSAPVERFNSLREIFTDKDEVQSLPTFLLRLIRAVRLEDDDDDDETRRDVYKRAKRRRRRIGMLSFTTGPMLPVATELTDLYCETATVCDLDDLYKLGLSDQQVGGHLLVLWELTDDVNAAIAAMHDETGIELGKLMFDKFGLADQPPMQTKLEMVKRIWEVQKQVNDMRDGVGGGAVTGVMFSGFRMKKFIKTAETRLGVMAT